MNSNYCFHNTTKYKFNTYYRKISKKLGSIAGIFCFPILLTRFFFSSQLTYLCCKINRMKKDLWITYAWKDNEGGNFDYLVGELGDTVNCKYDKVELVPGQRLWEQIGNKIMNSSLHGWAILITENSLKSQPCLEEIEYAVTRAISMNADFPLIGLLHGVNIKDVPASLRTRLCVNLKSKDWKEQIIAGLEKRAPVVDIEPKGKYIAKSYKQKNEGLTVFEVTPRFSEISHWRFAVPSGIEVVEYGTGPVITNVPFELELSKVLHDAIDGTIDLNGKPFNFYGCGNKSTAETSAFIRLRGNIEDGIFFGEATGGTQIPELWYPLSKTPAK